MRRLSGDRGSAATPAIVATFVAGILVGALAVVEVVPADKLPSAVASGDGSTVAGGDPSAPLQPGQSAGPGTKTTNGRPGTSTGNQPGTSTGNGSVPGVAPSKYQCRAGANGGSTDRGVTATEITLPTTIVASGLGASFLGEMRFGIEAVVDKVNRSGGICGRRLTIVTKDDGWDTARGAQYLGNYINDKKYFAIPVGASSEGLKVVINRGDIDRAPFPVVGTDGLAIDQYAKDERGTVQPWVWPVATATVSSARIMVNEAYNRGARKFAIVFDKDYNFGAEAAKAFNAEVKRLTGKDVDGYNSQNNCVKRYCGIIAGQNSYGNYPLDVKNAQPDFIALFMEPDTALTWMQDPNTPAASAPAIKYGYGGAQPLFTYQFEVNCREKCDKMVVWSGFKPNIEKYRNEASMQEYVRALRSKNRQADIYNQFTQSAYVGMQFFVEGLRKVGPELTRQRLKAVLDHITYTDPLTLQGTLTFTPTTRFANTTMQGFTMQYKGQPGYWRLGPILRDPRPGP